MLDLARFAKFGDSDWDGYAGATKIKNIHQPLIQEIEITSKCIHCGHTHIDYADVIIDNSGISIHMMKDGESDLSIITDNIHILFDLEDEMDVHDFDDVIKKYRRPKL